jgi:hypothetical protein
MKTLWLDITFRAKSWIRSTYIRKVPKINEMIYIFDNVYSSDVWNFRFAYLIKKNKNKDNEYRNNSDEHTIVDGTRLTSSSSICSLAKKCAPHVVVSFFEVWFGFYSRFNQFFSFHFPISSVLPTINSENDLARLHCLLLNRFTILNGK